MSNNFDLAKLILQKYCNHDTFSIEEFFFKESHENILQCYSLLNYIAKTKSNITYFDFSILSQAGEKIENYILTAPLHFFLSALTSHLTAEKKFKVKNKLMTLTKTNNETFGSLIKLPQTLKINDYKPIISIVSFNI